MALRFSIEVRDRRNPDRLLGTLRRRPVERLQQAGTVINMAVCKMPRLSTLPGQMNKPVPVSHVTFDVHYRPSIDGYTMAAEFRTDSCLEDLLGIKEFRLPGEDDVDHRRRAGPYQ